MDPGNTEGKGSKTQKGAKKIKSMLLNKLPQWTARAQSHGKPQDPVQAVPGTSQPRDEEVCFPSPASPV